MNISVSMIAFFLIVFATVQRLGIAQSSGSSSGSGTTGEFIASNLGSDTMYARSNECIRSYDDECYKLRDIDCLIDILAMASS